MASVNGARRESLNSRIWNVVSRFEKAAKPRDLLPSPPFWENGVGGEGQSLTGHSMQLPLSPKGRGEPEPCERSPLTPSPSPPPKKGGEGSGERDIRCENRSGVLNSQFSTLVRSEPKPRSSYCASSNSACRRHQRSSASCSCVVRSVSSLCNFTASAALDQSTV